MTRTHIDSLCPVNSVSIIVYVAIAGEVVWRIYSNKPYHFELPDESRASDGSHRLESRQAMMVGALAFSSTVLFIRAVYRTAEVRPPLSCNYAHNISDTSLL